ncbi:MAG: DUF5678 domain-containing protein [Anaerolineae bacterium]
MDTIVLEPNLRAWLEQDAEQDTRSINNLINEAVAQYLRERQQAKLDREIVAYEAMHSQLALDHAGEWVAIHQQELVDHDRDRVALYRRIRSRFGRTSVLIRQVMDNPMEEVWLRTPSTGRNVLNRLVMVLDGPKQTLQI